MAALSGIEPSTECGRHLSGLLLACPAWPARRARQSHGRDILLCACANIGVTVDGKVVVGRRLHHLAGVHRRLPQGQGSPLCLASVGSGMAAGAAFGFRAASSVGRRRHRIVVNNMSRFCTYDSCNEPAVEL